MIREILERMNGIDNAPLTGEERMELGDLRAKYEQLK
jgi:hypothetical protein